MLTTNARSSSPPASPEPSPAAALPTAATRRPELATAACSALMAALALWWWAVPSAYPMRVPDDMSLVSGPLGGAELAWALALGAGGVVTALVLAQGRAASRTANAVLTAVAVIETFVLCGIVADIRVLMLLGYLLALLGPISLLGLMLVSARRHRTTRYVLAGVVVTCATVVTVTGMADLDGLAQIGAGMAAASTTVGPMILTVAAAFGGGCLWAWCLVRHLRRARRACTHCGRMPLGSVPETSAPRAGAGSTAPRAGAGNTAPRAGAGTAATGPGWGTWVTVAAAVGPLPYGLTRMTWLTPWPFGMDHAELVAIPGLRLFGLILGLVAIGSSVLTIGLIRPWGEVFPRWIPGIGGRPVPPIVPTALAVLVGAVITIAGRSIIQVAFDGDAWLLLALPLPVWGPLLVAAGIAYHLRRRTRCTRCGRS